LTLFAVCCLTVDSMKALPMPFEIMQGNHARLLKRVLILTLSMLIAGCDSAKAPEFSSGLAFAGAENSISLGGFWFNVEGNGVSDEDRTHPELDPVGGYLFLYWIDDQGNVCHGQPGVSGQPGAVYVNAYQGEVYSRAQQGWFITSTQLVEWQTIPYRIDSYVSETQASGPHFVQYGNVMWRTRADGSSFINKGTVVFSVPQIVSVDTTNTLFPYSHDKGHSCNSESVPLPSIPTSGPRQDPNRCGTRIFPSTDTLSYADSLSYCLVRLPQGMNWTASP